MTDPRIIVAIDTFDLKQANVILDQLDPDLCMIKIGSVVFNALENHFFSMYLLKDLKFF
jgi:orotidine-5'-phosphate decarboxylase